MFPVIPKSDKKQAARVLARYTFSLDLVYYFKELAERAGFEPAWECLAPKPLSRRPRYDHFGTSPWDEQAEIRSVRLQRADGRKSRENVLWNSSKFREVTFATFACF